MIWAIIALYILGAITNALWTLDADGTTCPRYGLTDWLALVGRAVLWPVDVIYILIRSAIEAIGDRL